MVRCAATPARLLAAFVAAASFVSSPAAGQTAAEALAWARAEARRGQCAHTGADLIHAGSLAGETRDVAVVRHSVEGCGGGGNNSATLVSVLVRQGGRLAALPMTPGRGHPDMVERVTVRDGLIHVEGRSMGPDDPRCCPTLLRRQAYAVANGRVVAVAGR